MNFFSNIKIKQKLMLLIVIPFIGLLYLASGHLINNYDQINRIDKINNIAQLATKISFLLHETQKERGMTAGYIGSKGTKFKDKLPNQRELSNQRFKEFENAVKLIDFTRYPALFENRINDAIKRFNGLATIRPQVNSLSIKAGKAIGYYTKMNAVLLDSVVEIARLADDAQIMQKVTAYSSFLLSKERAGIERAVGANTLSQNAFGPGMRTKFNNLISAQESYMKTFIYYASVDATQFYKKTLQGKEIDEVQRIRDTLLGATKKQALVGKMKEFVGYGGLIHNFKNYVLRGTPKYQQKVQKQYKELIKLVNAYNALNNISSEEKALLNDIKIVFTKYYNGLPEVVKAVENGLTIQELDKVVKVSDGPAIKALHKLNTSLFSVEATYWFGQITKKINKLKQVDDYLANDLIDYINELRTETKNSLIMTWILVLIIFLVVSVVGHLITKNITNSLARFKQGLGFFFEYAIREKDYLKPMDVIGSDELAQMTIDMNEQIKKTEYIIEQDKKVVLEIDKIMKKVRSGFFVFSIKEHGATAEVEALRNNINEMLQHSKSQIDRINMMLDKYASGEYTYDIEMSKKKTMHGDMGSLYTSSTLLGQSVSQLLAMISNAGSELKKSTQVLNQSSQTLSQSSTHQAASLEETAAAVEEITANIQNSSENVVKMSNLADDLNSSADVGAKLAQETSTSMSDINDKVTTINEAIEVIDQIAFQTNILSLNAAVEAATAGEAGKGFAVVAQEVRNLAARSAEAAKDIKELVEDAATKSNHGKEAANKMIDGYTDLNQKIVQTKDIIDIVTTSSKEQKEGMVQINDVVNNLDKATQENASTAASIDNLSNEVAELSDRLLQITSTATFDETIMKQVCDVDLVNEIARYKNDHINFKDTNFAKLDTLQKWTVTDCKSCNLGKWILACESENRSFVNTSTWTHLKHVHEEVHANVQNYINMNADNVDPLELDKVADSIEEATYKVFDSLDNVLKESCN